MQVDTEFRSLDMDNGSPLIDHQMATCTNTALIFSNTGGKSAYRRAQLLSRGTQTRLDRQGVRVKERRSKVSLVQPQSLPRSPDWDLQAGSKHDGYRNACIMTFPGPSPHAGLALANTVRLPHSSHAGKARASRPKIQGWHGQVSKRRCLRGGSRGRVPAGCRYPLASSSGQNPADADEMHSNSTAERA